MNCVTYIAEARTRITGNTCHVTTTHCCVTSLQTRKTASIVACFTLFTELLLGSALIKSVTVLYYRAMFFYSFRNNFKMSSFTPRSLYCRGKSPRYLLDTRLNGPQSPSWQLGEMKILDLTRTRTPTSQSSNPQPVAIPRSDGVYFVESLCEDLQKTFRASITGLSSIEITCWNIYIFSEPFKKISQKP
jgi:hypothetical protein